MTAAKSSPFPITKISFTHNRSVGERTFVKSQNSNEIPEETKAEAKLAAREAAKLAALGVHCDLLGERALANNNKRTKSKRGLWKKKKSDLSNKKSEYLHADQTNNTRPYTSTSIQEDEEDLSLGWTTQASTMFAPTTATEGLTTINEDDTVTHSTRSGAKNLMKKIAKAPQSNDSQSKDINQIANSLAASGAYACSICGTIYDSLTNATRHEDKCLIRWVEMMEKNFNEVKARRLLQFPAEHMPPSQIQSRQVNKRELHHPSFNNPSDTSQISDVSFSIGPSALSNRPKYQPPRSTFNFTPPQTGGEVTLPDPELQKHMLITDEAAVNVVRRSKHVLHSQCLRELAALNNLPEDQVDVAKKASLLLKKRQYEAQQELAMFARERHYYGMVEKHSLERIYGPLPKYENPNKYYYNRRYAQMGIGIGTSNKRDSTLDKSMLPKKMAAAIKHRFEHAYDLIKEGPESSASGMDKTIKSKNDKGNIDMSDIKHCKHTLYINVVVKNSVQVVNNELQRMARGWWQSETSGDKDKDSKAELKMMDFQFEWIRAQTQKRVIQLAAVALASDFTPRKVAVQLSNDLYRLMGPQLQLRGVKIQTEIEYRSGQYFVLAVNVLHIDWILLFDHTAKQLARGQRRWMKEQKLRALRKSTIVGSSTTAQKKKRRTVRQLFRATRMRFPSRNEVVAQILAFLNRFHFIISLPLANILYYLCCKYSVDKYILTVVTDDIFRYVEKKGMEMQLEIKGNSKQASFMLAALRELREDDKKTKKMADEGEEGGAVKPILGPLMGSMIKEDAGDVNLPIGFDPPEALEFIAFEVDLPVGFLRLRWTLLHADSTFWKDAFFVDIMKYDNITEGKWSSNETEIGLPKKPDGINEEDFLNQTLEFSYLMPKSAFVKANMCYATHEITYYDNNCFVIKEKTLTPEVPYGNTFVAWTQYSIVNTGKNTCRMVCSVEAEFPNGPPMVARQIKSGMRSGTSEKFVLLGETICRYADAVP